MNVMMIVNMMVNRDPKRMNTVLDFLSQMLEECEVTGGAGKYSCDECPVSYKSKRNLYNHAAKVHFL